MQCELSSSRRQYWAEYFDGLTVHSDSADQLDISNERVMVQNFAFILESLGNVHGRRVLDCGCGTGTLPKLIHALGGQVEAFDIVESRIHQLQNDCPAIDWKHDDLDSWRNHEHTDRYDIITASEVLQYVDFGEATSALVRALRPDSRLVITVPNADCPIIQKASRRFDGNYQGVSLQQLPEILRQLFPACGATWRGIRFLEDQALLPYSADDWCDQKTLHNSSQFNRIQIVISKPASH